MKNRMTMTAATVAALMLLSGCGDDAASENNQSAISANAAMPGGGNLVESAGAPEPAPQADPEVEAKAAPEAESRSEPRAKTQAAPEAAPRATPKVEPKVAPKLEPKPAEKAPATPACAPEHRALGHC